IVHDPEKRPAGCERAGQCRVGLRRIQTLHRNAEPDGDVAPLLAADRLPLFGAHGWATHLIAQGTKPEDAARVGGAEAKGILLREQALARATHATDRRQARPVALADNGALARGERRMQPPEVRKAPDKAGRSDERAAVLG